MTACLKINRRIAPAKNKTYGDERNNRKEARHSAVLDGPSHDLIDQTVGSVPKSAPALRRTGNDELEASALTTEVPAKCSSDQQVGYDRQSKTSCDQEWNEGCEVGEVTDDDTE